MRPKQRRERVRQKRSKLRHAVIDLDLGRHALKERINFLLRNFPSQQTQSKAFKALRAVKIAHKRRMTILPDVATGVLNLICQNSWERGGKNASKIFRQLFPSIAKVAQDSLPKDDDGDEVGDDAE